MFTRPGTIDFLGSCRYLSTGKVGQILSINGGKTMPYCTIPQSSPLKKIGGMVVPIPSHGWFIIQAATVFRHLGFVEILKILKQTVFDVLVLD